MSKNLKDEVIEAIKDNNQLYADVADKLNVSVFSMPKILKGKSSRLTEFAVLKVVADFLKCDMDDLLIDDSKVEAEEHTKNTSKKVVP
jgi:hypothetical protein